PGPAGHHLPDLVNGQAGHRGRGPDPRRGMPPSPGRARRPVSSGVGRPEGHGSQRRVIGRHRASAPPDHPAGHAHVPPGAGNGFHGIRPAAGPRRHGGAWPRRRSPRPSVEAMTTNHRTAEQRAVSGPDPTGALGWGFGLGVQRLRTGPTRSVGTYGWDGGLGTQWANDPAEDLIGILMTNRVWESPA